MLTLANLITLFRIIVLVPAFVVAFLYLDSNPLMPWIAFSIFTFAAILDAVDGFVARAFHQKTHLGAFLDPLADKLLVTLVYILGVRHGIPMYVTALVVSRDLLIVLGWASLHYFERDAEIRPILLSKLNTACQFVTASLILLDIATTAGGARLFPPPILTYAFHLTVLTTLTSGVAYVAVWSKRMGGFIRPAEKI
ncbi:CDP-alcohol phosphatidyltransferase family protein [bacterium]|nr:CDP-alcohol phosphatidyltransferase family protein [bacterium]